MTDSRIQQRDLVRILMAERVKMLAYIDSLVRDEELAEDLYQEVCMLAAEKADLIHDEQHLIRWLRTTARFQAKNAIKKRRNQAVALDHAVLDQLESAWDESHRRLDSSEWIDALRGCVDQLPEKSQKLIRKRYIDQLEYPQLADELGRPVASLYVTVSRIMSVLSDCVNQHLGHPRKGVRG